MNLKRRNDLVFYGTCISLLGAVVLLYVLTGPFRTGFTWLGLLLSAVLWSALLARWDTNRQIRKARARAHVEGPRPINPDGTPYGYHQIRNGGWKHCDGCGLWGQTWNPHRCQAELHVMPATNKETSR
ncbi:hypothetical protein [Streptomyces sp. t39]|uniref:hypothetical protein n=1 Tax=Streptomyces sp. t39 TaxID=1828156 RepID=UPI0011CD80C7|nr:hypothetical protein [Streptomyces sp. t39]TXS50128.1 hypothetical protein EAO77_27860 [Streptomyces sp. t39]